MHVTDLQRVELQKCPDCGKDFNPNMQYKLCPHEMMDGTSAEGADAEQQ